MIDSREIILAARQRGQRALSEYDSKRILAAYGVPVSREILASDLSSVQEAARDIGFPVVLKACSADTAHKTELGLVAVNLADDGALATAFETLSGRSGTAYDGGWLVQEMVKGEREVMLGMTRDPQFGPSVMFGLGGIFTEILQDAAFRIAPVSERDALDMLEEIRAHRILDAFRGMAAVDRGVLARAIVALGRLALDHDDIAEIDINPLIIRGDSPVAVDGLVVLNEEAAQ